MKKIVVSGGFDPVHIGHLELLEDAKKLGDHLTVILNSDRFLKEKKGFIFMPFKERKEILLGFSCVDKVINCIDKDATVCETLKMLKNKNQIDVFANGGDRKNKSDIPEYKICKKNNIEMVFDVGGGKIQSSSDLVKQFNNYSEERPWGFFENLLEEKKVKVKKLVIFPKEKISVQYHNFREEKWHVISGKGRVFIEDNKFDCKKGSYFEINEKQIHSIENTGSKNLEIIEVQTGSKLSEKDIIRLKDRYGRD